MGESAGAYSVAAHLVANDGDNEGLFRGAVGISGGPPKVDGPERQQGTFDEWVRIIFLFIFLHIPLKRLIRRASPAAARLQTRSAACVMHHTMSYMQAPNAPVSNLLPLSHLIRVTNLSEKNKRLFPRLPQHSNPLESPT